MFLPCRGSFKGCVEYYRQHPCQWHCFVFLQARVATSFLHTAPAVPLITGLLLLDLDLGYVPTPSIDWVDVSLDISLVE